MKKIAAQILELDNLLKDHPYDLTARTKRSELINELCHLVLKTHR